MSDTYKIQIIKSMDENIKDNLIGAEVGKIAVENVTIK